MAIRSKIFLACESLLRVPPLLVIDEIFRYNFGLSDKWTPAESGVLWPNDPVTVTTDWIGPHATTDLPPSSPSHGLSPFLFSVFGTLSSYIGSGTAGSGVVNDTGLPLGSDSLNIDPTTHYVNLEIGGFDDTESRVGDLFKVLKAFVLLQLCAAALVCFVLSAKNLVKLYSYILAFSSVYLCFYLTPLPLMGLSLETLPLLLPNLVIRIALAGTYFLTRMWPGGYPEYPKSSFLATVLNILDGIMFSLFFLTGVIRLQGFVYLSMVILLQASLWTALPKLFHFLYDSWEDTKRIRNDFGISHLIQRETGRLRVNAVFRLFWISRALYDIFYQFPHNSLPNIFRLVMTNGSETLLGIIGLTVTVSAVAHQIGAVLLWILYRGTNSEADINRFGSISTVLFFILCLQTSLTSLVPEKRLDRLFKNVVLLSTALLHALHQMVAPLLHAFRSFQALQIRAVALSLVFLVVSIWSSVLILRSTVVSTWSVAVLALALEFKIKIIVSLLISLFVYFSQRIDTPEIFVRTRHYLREVLPQSVLHLFAHFSDQLDNDDIIFYLKSFSHSAEFLTGIFLFVNAVWIFLFESASAIRALGMGIHAYFNIWCESKKGWRIYCQRRTASKKIESLADANVEQLNLRRDDVCAICYEEMETAKVTLCGHLFHAVCLRKWLYVQNTCPLCHDILYAEEELDQGQVQPNNIEMENENGGVVPAHPGQLDNNRNHVPVQALAPPPPAPLAQPEVFRNQALPFVSSESESDEEDFVSLESSMDTELQVSNRTRSISSAPALLRRSSLGPSQDQTCLDRSNADYNPYVPGTSRLPNFQASTSSSSQACRSPYSCQGFNTTGPPSLPEESFRSSTGELPPSVNRPPRPIPPSMRHRIQLVESESSDSSDSEYDSDPGYYW